MMTPGFRMGGGATTHHGVAAAAATTATTPSCTMLLPSPSDHNSSSDDQQQRAVGKQRKGVCIGCGIKTHVVSVFKRTAITNEYVYQGICIKCHPDRVPAPALQAFLCAAPCPSTTFTVGTGTTTTTTSTTGVFPPLVSFKKKPVPVVAAPPTPPAPRRKKRFVHKPPNHHQQQQQQRLTAPSPPPLTPQTLENVPTKLLVQASSLQGANGEYQVDPQFKGPYRKYFKRGILENATDSNGSSGGGQQEVTFLFHKSATRWFLSAILPNGGRVYLYCAPATHQHMLYPPTSGIVTASGDHAPFYTSPWKRMNDVAGSASLQVTAIASPTFPVVAQGITMPGFATNTEMVQIRIITTTQQEFHLQMPMESSIYEMKERIQAQRGIPIMHQELQHSNHDAVCNAMLLSHYLHPNDKDHTFFLHYPPGYPCRRLYIQDHGSGLGGLGISTTSTNTTVATTPTSGGSNGHLNTVNTPTLTPTTHQVNVEPCDTLYNVKEKIINSPWFVASFTNNNNSSHDIHHAALEGILLASEDGLSLEDCDDKSLAELNLRHLSTLQLLVVMDDSHHDHHYDGTTGSVAESKASITATVTSSRPATPATTEKRSSNSTTYRTSSPCPSVASASVKSHVRNPSPCRSVASASASIAKNHHVRNPSPCRSVASSAFAATTPQRPPPPASPMLSPALMKRLEAAKLEQEERFRQLQLLNPPPKPLSQSSLQQQSQEHSPDSLSRWDVNHSHDDGFWVFADKDHKKAAAAAGITTVDSNMSGASKVKASPGGESLRKHAANLNSLFFDKCASEPSTPLRPRGEPLRQQSTFSLEEIISTPKPTEPNVPVVRSDPKEAIPRLSKLSLGLSKLSLDPIDESETNHHANNGGSVSFSNAAVANWNGGDTEDWFASVSFTAATQGNHADETEVQQWDPAWDEPIAIMALEPPKTEQEQEQNTGQCAALPEQYVEDELASVYHQAFQCAMYAAIRVMKMQSQGLGLPGAAGGLGTTSNQPGGAGAGGGLLLFTVAEMLCATKERRNNVPCIDMASHFLEALPSSHEAIMFLSHLSCTMLHAQMQRFHNSEIDKALTALEATLDHTSSLLVPNKVEESNKLVVSELWERWVEPAKKRATKAGFLELDIETSNHAATAAAFVHVGLVTRAMVENSKMLKSLKTESKPEDLASFVVKLMEIASSANNPDTPVAGGKAQGFDQPKTMEVETLDPEELPKLLADVENMRYRWDSSVAKRPSVAVGIPMDASAGAGATRSVVDGQNLPMHDDPKHIEIQRAELMSEYNQRISQLEARLAVYDEQFAPLLEAMQTTAKQYQDGVDARRRIDLAQKILRGETQSARKLIDFGYQVIGGKFVNNHATT